MYYSYRRRSSGSSFFVFLAISAVVILFISPRARRKVGGCLATLSALLMGVGKEVGRKVNQVGINISDKFRTYKLSDLGGFMRTYTASKGSKLDSNEEQEEEKIYFHDLTSRENQTEDDDEQHKGEHDEKDDIKKYPYE